MRLLSEPAVLTFVEFQLPFLAYFCGISIRKIALDRPGSPKLCCQFLLGIPLSLICISPLLYMFEAALSKSDRAESISAYLFTLGVVTIKGMILPEIVTRRLLQWLQKATLEGSPVIHDTISDNNMISAVDAGSYLPGSTPVASGNSIVKPEVAAESARHRRPNKQRPVTAAPSKGQRNVTAKICR